MSAFLTPEQIGAVERANRETRVECLKPGDRFRWLQKWYTVRRLVDVLGEPRVGVEVAELEDESRVTFLFPAGHFVAADIQARTS